MPTERQKQGGDYIGEELKSGERQEKNIGKFAKSMYVYVSVYVCILVKMEV